jgi:hypothetical protein
MLYDSFLTNQGKMIHKWKHYFPIYERFFHKYVNQSVVFWEIGVAAGGSLQLWKRYFGPFARIVGIDIDPSCKAHEEDQIEVSIGNQSDTAFLQSVIDIHGVPDVVLDDGSHKMSDVVATFDYMYGKLRDNGIYMVEDLHTAYWSGYEGGRGRCGTFIEKCKGMIDLLNARHCGLHPDFADSTFSISFFDSVAVFERMRWRENMLKPIMVPSP